MTYVHFKLLSVNTFTNLLHITIFLIRMHMEELRSSDNASEDQLLSIHSNTFVDWIRQKVRAPPLGHLLDVCSVDSFFLRFSQSIELAPITVVTCVLLTK